MILTILFLSFFQTFMRIRGNREHRLGTILIIYFMILFLLIFIGKKTNNRSQNRFLMSHSIGVLHPPRRRIILWNFLNKNIHLFNAS